MPPNISLPRGVHRIRSRGKDYYYFQIGRGTAHAGPRLKLPDDPRTPEFWATVRQLQGAPAPTDTIGALIDAYIAAWPSLRRKLQPSTQNYYRTYLEVIRGLWGSLPAEDLRPADVEALMDKVGTEKPGRANNILYALRSMTSWARGPRGLLIPTALNSDSRDSLRPENLNHCHQEMEVLMAIEITRTDMSTSELRAAAARTKDAKAVRRILAIALVLEGADRKTAAQACGMDRQTLRDWVHRYNAEGIAGLSNRYSAGPTPLLNSEQKAELARMVREGPDLEADGVVRWRCVDLKRKIEDRFGVVMHERTVAKQLAALGFRRLSVRPQHPRSDPLAQEAFKKTLPLR